MKKIMMLVLIMVSVGCGRGVVYVIDNSSRIDELEIRADLNDQLDAARDSLLALHSSQIDNLYLLLSQLESDLLALIQAEEAARIAGDQVNAQALAAAVAAQSIVNMIVQFQLLGVNSSIGSLQSQIGALQSALGDLEQDVNDLKTHLAVLKAELDALELRADLTESDIDALYSLVAGLQDQLDAEGTKVYKCDAVNSQERLFKINGVFYGVMNRVVRQDVSVITGSSSQTYSTPAMCQAWNGDLFMPNSAGLCTPVAGPFKATPIPGETITVPSYSTGTVKVVTSVKMALEPLFPGSYVTTDGGPGCHFSINSDGSANNLTHVQSL
jgi:cell division protein FtsL